jgi:hypothetical protein
MGAQHPASHEPALFDYIPHDGSVIMYLIEILLPLSDNKGIAIASNLYDAVHTELTDRFGGVTSFGRSPARGAFREGDTVVHDDIVVYEVMAESLDRPWWQDYRRKLEHRFKQNEIVIRASSIERI